MPYSSKWRVRLGYATGAQTLNGDVLGDIRLANSKTYFTLLARGSGISTLNFYGFGNNTPETEPASFYRVRQNQFTLEPGSHLQPDEAQHPDAVALRVHLLRDDGRRGPLHRNTDGAGHRRLRPDRCGRRYTGRGQPRLAMTGPASPPRLAGRCIAPVWSVPSTFGEVHARGELVLEPARQGTQADSGVQGRGRTRVGDYPFMNAAFIGGGATVRSLRYNRYAGDASLYGGAELRLRLARISALLASDLGVMGLVDVGRVFLEGESSDTWHPAYGGGIWLAFLNGRTRATVSAAGGEGSARFYFNFGLSP